MRQVSSFIVSHVNIEHSDTVREQANRNSNAMCVLTYFVLSCGFLAVFVHGLLGSWLEVLCAVGFALIVCVIQIGVVSWQLLSYTGTSNVHARRTASRWATTLGAVSLISTVPLSLVAASSLRETTIARQKTWVDSLIPRVEAYRRMNGHYPRSLSGLCDMDEAPGIWRAAHVHYYSNEGSYEFRIDTNIGLSWSWTSDWRTWVCEP